jgi:hypothetical protein
LRLRHGLCALLSCRLKCGDRVVVGRMLIDDPGIGRAGGKEAAGKRGSSAWAWRSRVQMRLGYGGLLAWWVLCILRGGIGVEEDRQAGGIGVAS